MRTDDVTVKLDLALAAAGLDQITIVHRPLKRTRHAARRGLPKNVRYIRKPYRPAEVFAGVRAKV